MITIFDGSTGRGASIGDLSESRRSRIRGNVRQHGSGVTRWVSLGRVVIEARRSVMLAAVLLAGCAMKVETPQEPPPTNYRPIVADYIRKTFLDPYSIRDAGIAQPRPGWALEGGALVGYKTGWAICVRSNAKNRMGAYTGVKENIYVIQDGRVVASGQELDSSKASVGCEGVQYEPFPEIEEPARRR